MDLKTEKLDIIQWLIGVTDASIVAKISALRADKPDWWDELPDVIKQDVELALKEADKGNGRSHEDVMKEIRADYLNT